MSDQSSNITQILSSVDNFIAIVENREWVKSAKTEDIKSAFKLSSFVEKTVEHMKANNSLTEFLETLNKYRNKNVTYDGDFFAIASDKLLCNFLQSSNISENSLDIAFRMYMALHPTERLEKCLAKVLLIAGSFEAISEFIEFNKSLINVKEIEYKLQLNYWAEFVRRGDDDIVINEINEAFSLYNVEKKIDLLIGVLSLNKLNENEHEFEIKTQNLLLKRFLQQMLDRSILSKNFWLSLFRKSDSVCLKKVCENFPTFLEYLLNFVIYFGSSMEKKDLGFFHTWQILDESISICPELSYFDLSHMVKNICLDNEIITNYVISHLNETNNKIDSDLWNELKNVIN